MWEKCLGFLLKQRKAPRLFVVTVKFLLVCGVLILVFRIWSFHSAYRFGNVYFKNNPRTQMQTIQDQDGKILIGPGGIAVSGKYPYLVGDVVIDSKCSGFCVDIETGVVQKGYFEIKGIKMNDYLTYSSLTAPYYAARTKEFFANMKKPKKN